MTKLPGGWWWSLASSVASHRTLRRPNRFRAVSYAEELEANLSLIAQSPKDCGTLALIVRRPDTDEREVLPEGDLDLRIGLVGDTWISRKSSSTPDGSANLKTQVTLMNSRVIALIAQTVERWPLAVLAPPPPTVAKALLEVLPSPPSTTTP